MAEQAFGAAFRITKRIPHHQPDDFYYSGTPLRLAKDNTIREKLEKESVMYQICDHVKELVILTMPMDNKLETFQNKIKEISNEKNVQKLLNQQ